MANWFTRRIEKVADVAEQLLYGVLIVSVGGAIWVFYEGLRGGPMYIAIGFFSALVLTIAVTLALKSIWPRHAELSADQKTIDDLNAEHGRAVEGLNTQIEELKRDKAALTTDLEEETKKYESELSQKEALSERVTSWQNQWNTHLFTHNWLFAKLEAQGKSIDSHVEVEKVYFCYQELQTPMLKSVFGIDFRNKSVFDISIDEIAEGHIEFEGVVLEAKPIIISPSGTIGTGGKGIITIEQRLSRAEADFIASKDMKSAQFNLQHLNIPIKGARFSPSKPPYLDIPKHLHSDPQAAIDLLNSQMAIEAQNYNDIIERLKQEQQFVEAQLWQRVKTTRALSNAMGYGKAINDRCQSENMTYPKSEIDEWAGRLWDALRWCFEEADIETFYSKIDPKCPGYERGVPRVIKVPEQNAERQLWLFYHLKRLSELINEQQHATTIIRKEEG